jgi:hypothetical protein
MRGSLLTPLAAAAFAAATINPAAAQFLLGNTGNWNTPSVGAPPYTFEARLYGGWSDASTFGWNVPADIVGGGAALRLPYGQFRFQADLSAEESNYSSSVGNPSFVVGATHFDWMVAPGSELGLFGGLDNALPSFSAPQNLNAFIGFEGRQFLGPAMFGLQAGYFDNVGGSGTLVRAGFVEGRFKLSLGDSIGIPSLRYTIVGADLGYASGTSTATSTGAQSTYWGASLSQAIPNTPFSVTFDYQHFNNHVDGTGTVWTENLFLGGLKVLLPSTDVVVGWKEPTEPLPIGLIRSALFF